jgi:hypothetical protein
VIIREDPVMTKFGFKIRTRGGMIVDNLTIPGRTQQEAERKLLQIYRHCEILEAHPRQVSSPEEVQDIKGMISLISGQ